jgi:multicomponent Na+:H+ antiporter subunit G
MSAASVLSAALLGVGVLAVLLSCLGVLLVGDAYDKLHYAGPANTVGTVAVAAALVLRDGLGQIGVKAILVALVLLTTNAALTHATARAANVRARRNGGAGGGAAAGAGGGAGDADDNEETEPA